MSWREPGDEITPPQVKRLNRSERNFHWAIAMGFVVMKDVARFMRVSAAWVSKTRRGSERRIPNSEVIIEDRRASRAVELSDQGVPQSQIAEDLGYRNDGKSVSTLLRRQRKKWGKFD